MYVEQTKGFLLRMDIPESPNSFEGCDTSCMHLSYFTTVEQPLYFIEQAWPSSREVTSDCVFEAVRELEGDGSGRRVGDYG